MLASEDQLVNQYLPLVRRLAWQMAGRLPANIEIEDLNQAGLMGLLDAIRRYEKQPDAQFETYAITRIRGAMIDELRSQDWLPRSVRSKAREIEQAISVLIQRLGQAPTETEIADELNLPLTDYQKMLEDAHGVQVLHYEDFGRLRDEEGGHPLDYTDLEQAGGGTVFDPVKSLSNQGLRAALIKAIKALPEREQLLLSLQFEQDLTQKEIAAVLEVTEGRVSQIRSQAVARIRSSLSQAGWEDTPDDDDYQNLL